MVLSCAKISPQCDGWLTTTVGTTRHHNMYHSLSLQKQEAQLSQRYRATLCVIREVTQGHSKSFEMTPSSMACVKHSY